ncbi:DUF4097 family beta strand repeat-containing protein [Colwellia sp. 12G3]|uniref:DUF4097 family beta strand repeat-containing protein n=1 Tax=Colwellia sp. 12G3 TaxID=2058299 RepID=UPI000C34B556|nr:DUF4097 family beta strand repeat-containing protein [Colwellia sp. 12G3]PKI17948.1 hypothetical protein CXF71_01340 [Colwellia sp. 12G3]
MAGEKINQSLSVEDKGIVFVEIPRGLVKIQGWDKQEVMVQGELDDTTNKLIFETKKDKTLIKIDTQRQQHWGDSSVLSIFMPQKLKLRFKGVDTSFNITQLDSHIEGKSISGNLVVKKSHGKIKLSVVSGDVTLVESSGLTKIESVSGKIVFSGDFEQVFLKSVSGDITAEISGTDKLIIKNISGDTRISGPVKNQAQLKLSSVSGDMFYKVAGELNAECEVVSQFGGEIKNQLTTDLPIDGNLHKKTLNFISGEGSGKLSMNTINGSVSIAKITHE